MPAALVRRPANKSRSKARARIQRISHHVSFSGTSHACTESGDCPGAKAPSDGARARPDARQTSEEFFRSVAELPAFACRTVSFGSSSLGPRHPTQRDSRSCRAWNCRRSGDVHAGVSSVKQEQASRKEKHRSICPLHLSTPRRLH